MLIVTHIEVLILLQDRPCSDNQMGITYSSLRSFRARFEEQAGTERGKRKETQRAPDETARPPVSRSHDVEEMTPLDEDFLGY